MVQPYDYRLNVPSPFEAFTGGIKIGQAGLEARERRDLIQARELERQAKQAAAEQEAARQAQVDEDLESFFSTPSYDTLSRLAPYIPKDQFQNLQATFEGKTKEAQQNELRFAGQVLSALATGNGNVASKLLRQRAEAIGSDTPDGKGYLDAAQLAEADPETAMMTTAIMLQALPGSKEIIDRAFAVQALPQQREKERLEVVKLGKENNLTDTQIAKAIKENEKLGFEVTKAKLEADRFSPGEVPQDKKFDMELKLSDRYQKKVAPLETFRSTFENMETSAAAETGQGDIALITQFMKMLDPGSVVRETEFATAQNAAGYYEGLKAKLASLKGTGELLTPAARDQYITLAKKYLEAAEIEGKQVESSMAPVIKNYGLNPENIFGAPRQQEVDY